MSQQYVYVYLNPLEPGHYCSTNISFLYKPFYIGQGKNDRLFSHIKQARPSRANKNSHKLNTIRTIQQTGFQPYVVKIAENLTTEEALQIELELILEFKTTIGLTNIRTSNWDSEIKFNKSSNRIYHSTRKDTITVYNKLLQEHAIIKLDKLSLYQDIFGKENIVNTSDIRFRKGPAQKKARYGESNGMHGKSAVRGKKWIIVNDQERFMFPEEIEKLIQLKYNVTYGRKTKPSGKRVIFEGELKGKYRTADDIHSVPGRKYQYGLVWQSTKPTYISIGDKNVIR